MKLFNSDFDLIIIPNQKNGLKKKSILKLSKIATLDIDLAIGKLGDLSYSNIDLINQKLNVLFKL